MIPAAKTALSDIETTAITYDDGGVIIYPETVHLLVSKDHERGDTHVFGPDKDHIAEGVDFLQRSETVVFHNGIGFDVPVLTKTFNLTRQHDRHFIDSLVLCRLFFSNVKEEEDFARFEKHKMRPADNPLKFTGDLVGKHGIEAWGLRLKNPQPKGKYVKQMELLGKDPWAAWNPLMQEYAIQDVVVLEALWIERLKERFNMASNQNAISVEHYLAELMEQVKRSGIKFNREWAMKLVEDLETHAATLNELIQAEFPPRLEPLKWKHHPIPLGWPDLSAEQKEEAALYGASEDPEDFKKLMDLKNSGPQQKLTQLMWEHEKNEVYRPRFNLPQGYLREQWGESFTPKVTRKVTDKEKNTLYVAEKDSPFTKCAHIALNPNSRTQIARRLLELGWTPEEFTDTGAPSLSEVELLKIEEQFPAARPIANYLLVQKRLGAVFSGDKAWLNLLDGNDFIHPTIHACNTVAFRASHSDPNISQVPSVKMKDVLDDEGKKVTKTVPKFKYTFNRQTNKWDSEQIGFEEKVKQAIRTGFDGKWGWDCRACFTVPEGFRMVGSDLAGIEMRAWAHYLWRYDNGDFADVVLNKDVHEENRVILGFNDRRKAKEWLYAAMYGAGDEKLGFIIDPLASPTKQKQLGAASRARFMAGLKGYENLNGELMLGVRRGYLKGLDGRRCPVRKQHAALNTLLQSAGAIISKYWIIFVMDILENEHNMKWGYENDFTLLLYSHDELQFAVRPDFVEPVKKACENAALKAGDYLDFRLPVEVGTDDGQHWGDTH